MKTRDTAQALAALELQLMCAGAELFPTFAHRRLVLCALNPHYP